MIPWKCKNIHRLGSFSQSVRYRIRHTYSHTHGGEGQTSKSVPRPQDEQQLYTSRTLLSESGVAPKEVSHHLSSHQTSATTCPLLIQTLYKLIIPRKYTNDRRVESKGSGTQMRVSGTTKHHQLAEHTLTQTHTRTYTHINGADETAQNLPGLSTANL